VASWLRASSRTSFSFSRSWRSTSSRRLQGSEGWIDWSTTTGAELAKLTDHLGSVSSVVFTSDGKRLAAASSDGQRLQVRVWQIERNAR